MNQAQTATFAAECIMEACGRRPAEVGQFLDRWGDESFINAWSVMKSVPKIGHGLDAIRQHHYDRRWTCLGERGCDFTWGLTLRNLADFRDQSGEWRLTTVAETRKELREILNKIRA